MEISSRLSEEISAIEASTSLSLEIGTDAYFDIIKGILNASNEGSNLSLIYIAATVPAEAIINAMQMIGLDHRNVNFIDCISNMITGQQKHSDRIIYIESPTMLENIMLKVEFLRRKMAGRRIAVVVDSLNTLHIHNDWKILGEFLHILVNNMRSRNASVIIISIKEQETQEGSTLLALVSDRVLQAGDG